MSIKPPIIQITSPGGTLTITQRNGPGGVIIGIDVNPVALPQSVGQLLFYEPAQSALLQATVFQ